jgi:2-polyprenyl-3-methyl-5-hydroxy-6-metoxy-1,4-benzoquinol methylase
MNEQTEQQIWDARYAAEDYIFGTDPADCLVRHAHDLPPSSRVLMVADGEGRNGVWLARQGHDVTSFDLSPLGVAKARKLAAAQNVALNMHISDVESWNWDAPPYGARHPARRIALFTRLHAAPARL